MKKNAKQRTSELVKGLDELACDIVTDPDKLAQFGQRWVNGFHHYSFCNYLLAWMQKRDCTLLAGFDAWKERGRYVKKDEKAIWILAPAIGKKKVQLEEDEEEVKYVKYFISVPVFDISQTDGKPIEVGCPELVGGTSELSFGELTRVSPLPVEVKPTSLANGATDGKRIIIYNSNDKGEPDIATLFHEIAHVKLGHTEMGDDTSRQIRELQAEAVSYLVCSSVGIKNEKAKYYIGHWQGTREDLRGSATKILKVAETMLRDIAGIKETLKIRKGAA